MVNSNRGAYIGLGIISIVLLGIISYLELSEISSEDVNATVDARVALVLTDVDFDGTSQAQQVQIDSLIATDGAERAQSSTEVAELSDIVMAIESQSTLAADNIATVIQAQSNTLQTEIALANPTTTPTPNDPFFLAPIEIDLNDEAIASNFIDGDFAKFSLSPNQTFFVIDALGEDGREARLYNLTDFSSFEIIPTINGTIADFAWSPDGNRIAITILRSSTYIFDVQTLELISRIDTDMSHITWSGDGQYLIGRESSVLYVWNPETGERVETFFLEGGDFRDVFVNSFNNQIWTFEGRDLRRLRINRNGTLANVIYSRYSVQGNIMTFNLSPNGQLIATTETVPEGILIWSSSATNISDALLNQLDGHISSVNKTSWSPNSQFLASLSSDNSVRVWYVDDRTLIYDLSSEATIEDINWFSNGHFVISTSAGLYILDLSLDTAND